MKFILLIFIPNLILAQFDSSCELEYSYIPNDTIKNNIELTVKNRSSQKIKIFKNMSVAQYQIFDIEQYNLVTKQFEKIIHSIKDIDYLVSKRNFTKLNPGKSRTYIIHINDAIHHAKEIKFNGLYRFKLLFETINLGECNFSSNYLYYKFE